VTRAFVLLLCGLAFGACGAVDTIRSGYQHSQSVAAALEKSLGTKPQVGFNWHNGALTSVTIVFESMPQDKTLAEIAASSRKAVLEEFEQRPHQIVLSFSLEP
jgi:hypothetical protein